MSLNYSQLIAYIDGLYADGSLSEQDYVDIINYIVSNGNPESDPRDLIQIRRGNVADLPELAQGEPAITFDTFDFYVGTPSGNKRIKQPDYYDVNDFGAVGDGVTDDYNAIASALVAMSDGDVLYFPNEEYFSSQELAIEKAIIIKGTSLDTGNGSKLKFNNTSGLILRKIVRIENLRVEGSNNTPLTISDVEARSFGNIGIKCEQSTFFNSIGSSTSHVSVTGFNVGMSFYKEGSIVWAGAYREMYDLTLTNCDVGLIVLDGATHNNFYGGQISGNGLHGVYSKTDIFFNALNFIGTAFEVNGGDSIFNQGDGEDEKYGIYSGKNSVLRFTKCYFEECNVISDDFGEIYVDHSYLNPSNCGIFAVDGNLKIENTFAPYYHDIIYDEGMFANCTFTNCVGSSISSENAHIGITSALSGIIKVDLQFAFVKGLLIRDIDRIEFQYRLKVNAGISGTNFGNSPSLKLQALDASSDTLSINQSYIVDKMTPDATGEYIDYNITWYPRRGGVYINETSLLNFLQPSIFFSSASDLTADYTINNLDVEIINPVVTVHTRKEFSEKKFTV